MPRIVKLLHQFFLPKLKFALTSALATITDYSMYLGLFYWAGMKPTTSNVISYSVGMVINFMLQKRFIFELKRNVKLAFAISASFSLIGLGLSTTLIHFFSLNHFLYVHQYLTKALVTGIIFFYNFYTKKFSFEKTF